MWSLFIFSGKVTDMKVKFTLKKTGRMIAKHMPDILVYGGTVGIGATAWLAFDAGANYAGRGDDELTRKDVVDILKKPVITGAVSATMILTGNRMHRLRYKRLGNAYNKLASDYRALEAATIGAFGMEGRKKILEEQAKQRDIPRRSIPLEDNQFEFYDSVTSQTFISTLTDVYDAQADIASILSHEFYLSLKDYCNIFGIPHRYRNANKEWVECIDDLGWDSSELYEYMECSIPRFFNQRMEEPDGYVWYHMSVDIPPTVDGVLNGTEPPAIVGCYDEYGIAKTASPWMNGTTRKE